MRQVFQSILMGSLDTVEHLGIELLREENTSVLKLTLLSGLYMSGYWTPCSFLALPTLIPFHMTMKIAPTPVMMT